MKWVHDKEGPCEKCIHRVENRAGIAVCEIPECEFEPKGPKPCPFCGGKSVVNQRYRGGVANRKMFWVSCKRCHVSQAYDDLRGYRNKARAIEAWNKRAEG